MSVWTFLLGEGLGTEDYERIAESGANTEFGMELFEVLESVEPDHATGAPLGAVVHRLGLQDLAIAHYGRRESEDEEAWENFKTDPEGVRWAWLDPQFQRPPLAVAAAADRLKTAIESRDPDVRPFCVCYGVEREVDPSTSETQASYSARRLQAFIEDLDDLAKACRMMAENGVERVTFSTEFL